MQGRHSFAWIRDGNWPERVLPSFLAAWECVQKDRLFVVSTCDNSWSLSFISSFMVILKGANELKAVGTPNNRIRTSRASKKSFSTQDSQKWRRSWTWCLQNFYIESVPIIKACSNHWISFRNWAKVDSNQGTHWHELVPVKPRGVNSMSIIGSFNSNWGLRCHGHFWWFKLLSNGVIVLFLVVSWFADLLVGHWSVNVCQDWVPETMRPRCDGKELVWN